VKAIIGYARVNNINDRVSHDTLSPRERKRRQMGRSRNETLSPTMLVIVCYFSLFDSDELLAAGILEQVAGPPGQIEGERVVRQL
jgi:hypothetical protein